MERLAQVPPSSASFCKVLGVSLIVSLTLMSCLPSKCVACSWGNKHQWSLHRRWRSSQSARNNKADVPCRWWRLVYSMFSSSCICFKEVLLAAMMWLMSMSRLGSHPYERQWHMQERVWSVQGVDRKRNINELLSYMFLWEQMRIKLFIHISVGRCWNGSMLLYSHKNFRFMNRSTKTVPASCEANTKIMCQKLQFHKQPLEAGYRMTLY